MATPVYQQLAKELRDLIDSGGLGEDGRMPTQDELIDKHKTEPPLNISRGSIRRAYEELIHEGLVVSRRPQGMFVRDRRRIIVRPQDEFGRPPSDLMDWFMGVIAEQGGEPSQTIDVAVVHPPADVAKRLQTEDEVVVVRRRVRFVDGERYNLNDSYYPRSIVSGSEIELPDDIARGANQVLAELGALQVYATDEYIARVPTSAEVARLDLPPATPIIEQITVGYDGETRDSRPVRCVITIFPADRHRIVYERRRPSEGETQP